MSFAQGQDWEVAGWNKGRSGGRIGSESKEAALNRARRAGNVSTEVKYGAGNRSAHSNVNTNMRKLEEDTETFKHDTVDRSLSQALQKARLDKGMTQKALATAINEKPQVIGEYESGRAIPNPQIISKIERALGCRNFSLLPSASVSIMRLSFLILPATFYAIQACDVCQYTSYACEEGVQDRLVCNEQGHVQVDDVFCAEDCVCADGYACVSLHLGCTLTSGQKIPRCISTSGVQARFDNCRHVSANAPSTASYNLTGWLKFRDDACFTEDCFAAKAMEKMKLFQCGRLVSVWKEGKNEYHFIAHGTLQNNSGGNYHIHANYQNETLENLTISKTDKCYTLRTRNTNNAKCKGYFISALQSSTLGSINYDLSWPVCVVVIVSVVAAIASVVSVAFFGLRASRTKNQSEPIPDGITSLQ
ncbi:hypothetical protein THRCLA_21818 [Thraustotheca clavata]|uniref:HTH cro/C1-type domain-containing protein n=1 Tax=Thraustotheca clavata TaxID=74557 RepID=A0A1V9ZNI9_9STRA|nr:hypothetical protein THRCLA_21818 [Thraustotheca clavata]